MKISDFLDEIYKKYYLASISYIIYNVHIDYRDKNKQNFHDNLLDHIIIILFLNNRRPHLVYSQLK